MRFLPSFFTVLLLSLVLFNGSLLAAGGDKHDHSHDGHEHGEAHEEEELDLAGMIIGHILDANEFHLFGDFSIPLPCMVYHKEKGFDFFLSNVFHHGHNSYNGYVLDHGRLKYSEGLPDGIVDVGHFSHEGDDSFVEYNGQKLEAGRTAFYDFSITKVVFTMFLTTLIMLWLFPKIARSYGKNDVPKGIQSFMEPIITFVRDDIAKPNLGDKWEKFFPYLATVFFFIWINNLLGLVPFFPGGGNVMGNISVTLVLALIAGLIINLNGKSTYWGHIFNPPGVPAGLKPLMILIEMISILVKPFALFLRLTANITAGHIIILSLVGLIFIAGSLAGNVAGFASTPIVGMFLLFMNVLEMFVAALQAYIFTVLAAVFIGQAVEEHHHDDHGHAHAH